MSLYQPNISSVPSFTPPFPVNSLVVVGTEYDILVKTLSGKIVTLAVNASDTIEKVQKKIEDVEGIRSHHQIFLFDGSRLQCGRTLREYHITHESMLHVALRFCEYLVPASLQVFLLCFV